MFVKKSLVIKRLSAFCGTCTGDIEQTIVLGAHGPYRVHLVIVEN
jgi:L-lactate utilization protein LutC